MHKGSCEWVIPGKELRIVCLMPSSIGMRVLDVMPIWGVPPHARVYNWHTAIDASTPLCEGMRINFLLPLVHDPKQQRRIALHTHAHTAT